MASPKTESRPGRGSFTGHVVNDAQAPETAAEPAEPLAEETVLVGIDVGLADAAEHAAKAAAQAEAESAEAIAHSKALNAAQDAKEKASRLCPNCGGHLIKHGDSNPFKAGASHCNGCGACWAQGLKTQRAGHPAPPAKA